MNTLKLAMFNLMEMHQVATRHPNQRVDVDIIDGFVRLTTSGGTVYDTGV